MISARMVMACVLAAAVAISCAGCRGKGRTVSVQGSTSIQPFAEELAQAFHKRNPGINVEVQGGGSTAGIQALTEGIADIGMCSRELNAKEAEKFKPIIIARDGLAVVVHKSNPVAGLTTDQVRRVFAGEISNWKEVGGPDAPIRCIVREEGSGTREAFTHLVMGKTPVARNALAQESNGAVKELVKGDPGGIGYMSLGLVGGELKMLSVDGAVPSAAGVAGGKYPLSRPFLFAVKGSPKADAQLFIDFVLSDDGQRVLEKEGLVRAK